jgi:peptidyl-prolyl cis-trans isomerase D
MAGPTLTGNLYTISRVADMRMMPDSVGAHHIVLDRAHAASADSIITALKNGADIFALAPAYSIDQRVELGVFQPETMVEPFANALIAARPGEIFKVDTQFGTHVVKMTRKTSPVAKYRIATVKYNVDPSPATEQAAYNSARDFLAAAAGSKEKFDAAVSSTGSSLRVATVGEKDREVRGLADSRELVRWSFNAKVGTVSTIMDIDGDYVVAVLAGAKEAGIANVADVSQDIAQRLRTDKKTAMLTERVAGKSIDDIAALEGASKGEFASLKFTAFYEPSFGLEPAVIGAVSSLQAGSVSKPVKGYNGVFVVSVDSVEQTGDTNEADERVRLEANTETSLPQRLMQALNDASDVKDYRAKFF